MKLDIEFEFRQSSERVRKCELYKRGRWSLRAMWSEQNGGDLILKLLPEWGKPTWNGQTYWRRVLSCIHCIAPPLVGVGLTSLLPLFYDIEEGLAIYRYTGYVDVIFHIYAPVYWKKSVWKNNNPVYYQEIEERCLQSLNTVHDFKSFDAFSVLAGHGTGTVKRMMSRRTRK